jgi:hypothetical protein
LTIDGKAVEGNAVPAYGDARRHVVEAEIQ